MTAPPSQIELEVLRQVQQLEQRRQQFLAANKARAAFLLSSIYLSVSSSESTIECQTTIISLDSQE